MDRNYGMEIVRATEQAALTASKYQGMGEAVAILQQTRKTIWNCLNVLDISGWIKNDRFEEVEEIESYPSEIGRGGDEMDVMVAAIEGHKICARGGNNASSYIAVARKDVFLTLPNVYMNKIVVGPQAHGVIDINESATTNIKRVARALKKYIGNITVCILDRERNAGLIKEVQDCGARIRLIQDGDISGALATTIGEKVDILMGLGGAHEGVMAAAALKCLGGCMQAKLHLQTDEEKKRAEKVGITDFDAVLDIDDMIRTNEVVFAATGITDGAFLQGVELKTDGAETDSFVCRGETRTFRSMKTRHYFDYKRIY